MLRQLSKKYKTFPVFLYSYRNSNTSGSLGKREIDEGTRARIGREFARDFLKRELKPEISLLHMKVLTLIKAKSNVFL